MSCHQTVQCLVTRHCTNYTRDNCLAQAAYQFADPMHHVTTMAKCQSLLPNTHCVFCSAISEIGQLWVNWSPSGHQWLAASTREHSVHCSWISSETTAPDGASVTSQSTTDWTLMTSWRHHTWLSVVVWWIIGLDCGTARGAGWVVIQYEYCQLLCRTRQ